MINVILAIHAAGFAVEAETEVDRIVRGTMHSTSLAAALRGMEMKV